MVVRRRWALTLVLAATGSLARTQDIEPRSYANAPVGVNFAVGGFAYTWLGFPLDPAVPLTDPKLNTSNAVLGFARVIDVAGKSAKLSVIAPYAFLKGSALYAGEPVSREVNGFTDVKLRLAVNLFGAPAMDMAAFKDYKQDLILGASLTVSTPTGQYDPERLVNIGAHRWSLKGELGASQAAGKWIMELSTALEVFTTNADFYGG
ncbi:MAG TPA: transporter, partial [Flavobacteriales bacterium]|nr:transporter [Flavobacteriales bacterium]